MLTQAQAGIFRLRVNLWSRITGRGAFDWEKYEQRLEGASFRQYASAQEALQSPGYFGQTEQGQWLFAIAGHYLPLYGKSAMRHELFHAAQATSAKLLEGEPRLLRSLAAEYSAHLWGGPLIGLPLAYGGTLFIVVGLGGLCYAVYALIRSF